MMIQGYKKYGRQIYTVTVAVFVVILALGVFISALLFQQQSATGQARVRSLAQSYAFHLQHVVEQNLSASYTLAGLVREFDGDTGWFPGVAEALQNNYRVVNNFALSPQGVVKHVYPLQGNEQVIGFNQLADSQQGSEAWVALTKQQLTLAGPMDLVQGGKGLVARLPITLEDSTTGMEYFWGFSSIVIRLEPLLDSIKFNGLSEQGYAVQLQRVDSDYPIDIVNYDVDRLESPVHIDITLPNAQWRLSVSPKSGWIPNELFWIYVLVSLVVAAVMARFVFLAFRMRDQKALLTDLLAHQETQNQVIEQRFKSTLQAVPDPLIEIDANGIVKEVRTPDDEAEIGLFFIPDQHYSAHLSEHVKHIFEVALNAAQVAKIHRGAVFKLERDERTVWFEISVVCDQPEERDTSSQFIVLLRDITVRQDAEEQLRIAATAFETQDGILISDKHNRIIRVNQAFQDITGFSEQEVIGETPAILNSGRHSNAFYQQLYQELHEQGRWEGEVWNRRKNGEVYPEWLSISTVRDQHQTLTHFVATFKDISERKASERQIRQLHYYDTLTRLANRTLLLEEMTYLTSEQQLKHHQSAVLFIDIDHFKDVNDVWGHGVGDELLKQVAERLVKNIRANDRVARFGGDEFLVLLEKVDISKNPERALYRASSVAQKLLDVLSEKFLLQASDYQASASIGIAIFDENSETPLDVIKQAELAMYEAKASGRSQFCFYQASMQERVLERVHLENDLRQAIEAQQLLLYVQPQWNAQREMIGAEALLRWQHPERGMVSPAVFIPLAEETKLILPIGEWVLHCACEQLSKWREQNVMTDFVMSINVSAVQFAQHDFVTQVERVLNQYNIPADSLQLELTESMLAHDQQDIIAKMTSLKALGVLISLDDFGTGYSSLSYLHRLPIDQLKIDQSFIANLEHDEKNASLAESIISLGHNLGMEVIAEGVETDEQFEWLIQQHCDLFQGFGLARPMPLSELLKQLDM